MSEETKRREEDRRNSKIRRKERKARTKGVEEEGIRGEGAS